MVLSLADFECSGSAPHWLPSDKWDDILAASVLPGPLDCVCVKFVEHSDEWKQWYELDSPEREPTPLETHAECK